MDYTAILKAAVTAVQLASAEPATEADDVCAAFQHETNTAAVLQASLQEMETATNALDEVLAENGVVIPTNEQVFADGPADVVQTVDTYFEKLSDALTQEGVNPKEFFGTHNQLHMAIHGNNIDRQQSEVACKQATLRLDKI